MRRGDQFFNPNGRQSTPRRITTYVKYGPENAGPGPITFFPDVSITSIDVDNTGTTQLAVDLPDPSQVPASQEVTVKDRGGNAASVNIVIGTMAGSIEAPATIDTDGGWRTYTSDGVSKWSLVSRDATSGPSLPTTDNQIVFISGGLPAGSSNLAWNDTDHTITLSMADSKRGIDVYDHLGASSFYVKDRFGACEVSFGDVDQALDGTQFFLNVASKQVFLSTTGAIYLGDITGIGNSTQLVVDDAAQLATFNKPFDFQGDIILTATSGAPADTPSARTMRYDAGTNKLWIYNGSAWKSVTLT